MINVRRTGLLVSLHAVAGALIGINVVTGWQLDRFPADQRNNLVMIHAGFGLSILALMLIRWWWAQKAFAVCRRTLVPAAGTVTAMDLLSAGLSCRRCWDSATHCFIDNDVRAFGLFNISALAEPNPEIHALLFGAHSVVAGLLLVLNIAHVADRTVQQD